jgi:hypothetical protein
MIPAHTPTAAAPGQRQGSLGARLLHLPHVGCVRGQAAAKSKAAESPKSPKAQKLKDKRAQLEAQLAALDAEEEEEAVESDSDGDDDEDTPAATKDGKKRKRK